MEAVDFEVDIASGAPDGYQVTVRAPEGGEAVTTLHLPFSPRGRELDARLARLRDSLLASSATVRGGVLDEERPVQELGRTLFDALLAGHARGLLMASRQRALHEGKQLRLVLRVRPPELARLPWEFLFDADQDDYLCLNTSLIRYPPVLESQRPLRVTPPLRVLGMVARPGDQQELAIEEERRRLGEALLELERHERVELGWVAGQTWRALQSAMRHGPWHVFHFIGHGGFHAEAREGTLALTNDEGGTYQLRANDLAMLLRGHQSLRLVVLNACDTGRASALDPFSSVAGALMRRGLPAVLAMQFEITDPAAIEFSRTFYGGVASQLPIDVSVTDARQAIRLALPGTLEWGTPVLYLRSPDGHIFDLADAPPVAKGAERQSPADGHVRATAVQPVDDLYVEALSAFYTERWDRAVELFRQVATHDRGYRDAEAKLDEARRQQRLADTYKAAAEAAGTGDWNEAVRLFEAVTSVEPAYRDVRSQLQEAQRRRRVAELCDEVRWLHRAGKWGAVVTVGTQLADIDPDLADPDGLVSAARSELRGADEPHDPGGDHAATLDAAHHAGHRTGGADPSEPRAALTVLTTITRPKVVVDVAPAPDGQRLAITHADPTAVVVDIEADRHVELTHGGVVAWVWSVAFSPDGQWLATGSGDKTARVWDANTGREHRTLAHDDRVVAVVFSPDGKQLATGSGQHARIFDTASGLELRRLTHSGVTSIAFSSDGRRLATGSANETVRIWDATGGHRLRTLRPGGVVGGVAFGSGSQLAAGSGEHALIIDATTGQVLRKIACGALVADLAFSPDGRLLATGSIDTRLRVWDASTGGELVDAFHAGSWYWGQPSVAFSADGRWLAFGGGKTVDVWEVDHAGAR